MTANQVKVIVSGDVVGQFDRFFKRLTQLHTKNGPFDLCLCCGQFFSPLQYGELTYDEQLSKLRDGVVKIPVPTFFIGGASEGDHRELDSIPTGGKICENLFYLGKSGIKQLQGLRVAFLSGLGPPCQGGSQFAIDDIDTLVRTSSSAVDIFLSNQWPSGIFNKLSHDLLPKNPSDGNLLSNEPSRFSNLVSKAVRGLKPRYHFAALQDVFWMRPSYKNRASLEGSFKFFSTRFLGLGKVFNSSKQRYLYAINLTPANEMSEEQPISDLSENPWPPSAEEQAWENDQKYSGPDVIERFGGCFLPARAGFEQINKNMSVQRKNRDEEHQHVPLSNASTSLKEEISAAATYAEQPTSVTVNQQMPYQRSRKRAKINPALDPSQRPQGCWFCLSSPKVETHLVTSIATHSYLAMAKGALVPGHSLIVPISHTSSFAGLRKEESNEIQKYLNTLREYFSKNNLHCVAFERFVPSRFAQHTQIQVIPLPGTCNIQSLEAMIIQSAKALNFSFVNIPDPENTQLSEVVGDNPYFFMDLPMDKTKRIVSIVSEYFPMNFGRDVISQFIGQPQRSNWKTCVPSKQQEERQAQDFKNQFQPFDFSAV